MEKISLILLTAFVFYQTSWDIISKRLTQSVVADIKVIIKLIDQNLESEAISIANDDFRMKIASEFSIEQKLRLGAILVVGNA